MNKIVLLCFFILISCKKTETEKHPKIIVLQPLGNFQSNAANEVLEKIKEINPNVVLRKAIDFPLGSYYKSRNRFRADSIIKNLKSKIGVDSVIVGLSNKDISTTKGKIRDWGVMGLGYHPGRACVVSDFRLSNKNKKEQFYKVVLHELGHTEGLPHCETKTCLMRDAAGGNPIDQEKNFCKKCSTFLKSKNWNLK
ncbi:Zn-dependent protease [Flavobacterium sp. MC2016-06]|jgi:archaemetzincin|uniref:Zn-dependent protease n=1 Tax=Flavobacterium sp. MC2016-06 TaxID=2676308 RepID=UPI0012BB1C88|nr:Zn-dependent protease [Flavobacterium sp. MC2016-06]MBU3858484.1 Zn-dependent protease [Flavobacterium sp. MC2016-06]